MGQERAGLCPTSQALLGLRSASPVTWATYPVRASEVFTDHAVPFQCSSSVLSWWWPSTVNPPAHASPAEAELTASRLLALLPPTTAVGTSDQAVPFQW